MKKGLVWSIVVGIALLILIAVAVLAASVGKEASVMDTLMKDDLHQHKPVADVQKQLSEQGYTVEQPSPQLKASGPNHSILIYSTHLKLDVGFNEAGQMISYHLDRA
jgi:hypothetical protein